MGKGGRRSTSWAPGWRKGSTKTIRVPIALAEQILVFARALDGDKDLEIMINKAIAHYQLERLLGRESYQNACKQDCRNAYLHGILDAQYEAQKISKSSLEVRALPTPERNTVVSEIQWVEVYPTKRGKHHYFRYCYLPDPKNIRSIIRHHIPGGNVRSGLAQRRMADVEAVIADGKCPTEIENLIKAWRQIR